MKNPRIRTKVVHSQSKPAWNVIGTIPGMKYKIARFPYVLGTDEVLNHMEKQMAFEHAYFVSYCFNNSDSIINNIQ